MPYSYITTPIYYVNDIPHIGHAYTSIAADIYSRFCRLKNDEVFFLTGTDEHGQKVQKAAENKNMSAQKFTDHYAEIFKKMSHDLELSNNDFIRTTEERHKISAQNLWKKLMKNGYIYLDKYSGWYAMRDECFYTNDEIIDGKAPTGAPVEWVEEPSYFFKLSAFGDKLLDFYRDNPDFIVPKYRYNEVVSFVKNGLRDLSISRTSFTWGIKVPDDEKHIMYVWLDALTNYITALGYPDNEDNMKKFWPEAKHFVGKDILRFHAIYWPAFLMAADLPLPKQVIAHGWWMNEGQKMSKSIGNVIDPYKLIEEFGLDSMRYYLMKEIPFGSDGNYSHSSIIRRLNSELANDIGNLVQRTVAFICKNCEGLIQNDYFVDNEFTKQQEILFQTYLSKMQEYKFSEALEMINKISSNANGYINNHAPWALKDEPEKMRHVLADLLIAIRYIGIMLQAFMPNTSNKIFQTIGINTTENIDYNNFKTLSWNKMEEPIAIFNKFTM